MKKVCLVLLLILSVSFLSACSSDDQVAFVSLNGESSVLMSTVSNGRLEEIPAPTRGDGAVFQGWYSNLSFDESYLFDKNKKVTSNTVLYAKWSKPYIFSIRYGKIGFCGEYDDGEIIYAVPAGSYEIEFAENSSAKGGSILILNSSVYNPLEGYQIVETISFSSKGQKKNVLVEEGQLIQITVNSVFGFINLSAPDGYTSTEYNFRNADVNYLIILCYFISGIGFIYLIIYAVCGNDKSSKKIVDFVKGKDKCTFAEIANGCGLSEFAVRLRLGLLGEVLKNKLKEYKYDYNDDVTLDFKNNKKNKIGVIRKTKNEVIYKSASNETNLDCSVFNHIMKEDGMVKSSEDKSELIRTELSIKEKLKQLQEMYDSKLISKEEFEQKRKEIIDKF
ncbi:MAG: InlB B-repeat-containing protein [Clostridia bacterium]|nr:InlB B-repeat-containing protein [Clostridia bacterium]